MRRPNGDPLDDFARRTHAVCRLVVDGRPDDARRHRGADDDRHRAVARREPRGRDPHRARCVLLREPARDVSRPGVPGDDRDLVPDPAPDPARVARRVHRLSRPDRRDAGVRRRSEGRAALDRACRHQHPAFRIREARLRDPDLLAVRRVDAQVRHAGEYVCARAARCRGGAAGAAAGFRPDHADRAGVGRAVLHGRDAHDLGRRARRQRRGRACRRLFLHSARDQAHQPLHGPGLGRHLPGLERDRNPSCAAAGSAAARARGR